MTCRCGGTVAMRGATRPTKARNDSAPYWTRSSASRSAWRLVVILVRVVPFGERVLHRAGELGALELGEPPLPLGRRHRQRLQELHLVGADAVHLDLRRRVEPVQLGELAERVHRRVVLADL